MPFTVSHVAAIVPLNKKIGQYFVFSALVIGSMSPDIFYFLPFGIISDLANWYSHSFLGIFYLDVPMGLLCYYIFHLLLSPVFYSILPMQLQYRLDSNLAKFILPKKSFVLILFSLFIGALTHVIWDSFTHYYGMSVQYFQSLQQLVFHIDGYNVYLYRLLQHLSSVIGLILLFIWFKQWYKTSPKNVDVTIIFPQKLIILSKINLIIIPLSIGLMMGLFRSYLQHSETNWIYKLQIFTYDTITISGGVFLLTGCILGGIYKYYFTYKC